MNILGISCYYHDSAAALIQDGKILAAAQEERFSRKKHDAAFPSQAIDFCLSQTGLDVSDLSFVVFYDKPLLKFDRILETYLAYAPFGIRSFLKAMPLWLKEKLWIPSLIKNQLKYQGPLLFTDHHEAHAASAFYPSPFERAAFLTVDGVGEWTTTSFGIGYDNRLEMLGEQRFPHSLGLLYSAFTYFTGFKVNSAEYKVMGLAPYGEPKYVQTIYDHLVDLKEDGSFKLNMKYFNYCSGLRMTSEKFNRLFGGPPRNPESTITQRDMDLARSVQEVTEEIMLRMARHIHQKTGEKNLVLSGGVALNCVTNGRILREGPYSDIWIQPASGDAGGAVGAALAVWYGPLNNRRMVNNGKEIHRDPYLGPSYTDGDIEKRLKEKGVVYRKLSRETLPGIVADLLIQQKVIGWFQGRMEFGPRALGARSIIGDARSPEMQSLINLKIKFRESFRPFAPAVLKEKASDYFQLDRESPYMLLVAPVVEERKNRLPEQESQPGFKKLKTVRSDIPAVTHVDYSARIQTVDRDINALFYDLIESFYHKTGCPVIINTSFNVRGEPIVCKPEEALRCFIRTQMDYLVMGNFLIDKTEQRPTEPETDWMKTYELD